MSWQSMHGDWIAEDGGRIGPLLVFAVCFGPFAWMLWMVW